MGAINLSADINKAIEQIAKSLGITVKEIIPHYSKRSKAEAVAFTVGGALKIVLPWFIFLINLPDSWNPLAMIVKYFICFCFIATGIGEIIRNVDMIKAPEAYAISQIITELSGFINGEES